MLDSMESSTATWKELADQKQREWKNVLESRIQELEKYLKEKDTLLEVEKSKFIETKEHFKYNLKLLEERDRELEKYDVIFSEIKGKLNSKDAEISELKIHVDDLKNVIQREDKMKEEMQSNYQRRLREKQIEVDSYKSCKDGELNEERKEYEKFRRNLQRQLTNIQNEVDTQKRELTTEFENAMKKREHEFRVQSDALNAKVLEHELKVKLLEKELELVRESNDKTLAVVEEAESEQRNLEKLFKQKEWEVTDVTAVKDSQISELSNKLTSSESSMKKLQDDVQRKCIEMDKAVREKEETIERVKNGYLEREETLKSENQSLLSKLEDAQIKERQLSWTIKDLTKEKELEVEKLQDQLNDVKEKWDRHVAEMSRNNVSRDLELSNALEEQRRLKSELDQRKEDLNRYKNELKLAAEREENLDRQKTQIDLDWQRRTEDVENQQYQRSEDLIDRLSIAKNSAEALVKERERELQHKILLIKSLNREKDQLRALLKKHDIPLDNFIKYSLDKAEESEVNYVEDLQKQNAGLRELVSQMRLEMESLVQGMPPNHVVMDKIKDLKRDDEKEEKLQELRRENQMLKERLNSAKRIFPVPAPSEEKTENVLSEVQGNAMVKNHILTLNEAVGSLRSEKVELAATVKKQQARIAYLENSLEESSKQPRLKQIQIDQLTYEINSLKRHYETESSGSKNRISELELQLSEARREADEFHRASLERNQELVALGNQLSALKMEMTDNKPTINFGAQELYIQQLQNELSHLRKRASALEVSDVDVLDKKVEMSGNKFSSSDYKMKLKSAAAKIVQLAKENQQLTESNNRLRAELKAHANSSKSEERVSPYMGTSTQGKTMKDFSPPQKESVGGGRLSQLEQLQYELTRKELQYAHRFQKDEEPPGLSTNYSHYSEVEPERNRQRDGESNPLILPPTQTSLNSFPTNESSRNFALDPNIMMSLSSGGGESIQKVWQMLEDSGPSIPVSPKSARQREEFTDDNNGRLRKSDENDAFFITGQKTSARSKGNVKKSNPRAAAMTYAKSIKVPSVSKPKIRNYNVQDDNRPK